MFGEQPIFLFFHKISCSRLFVDVFQLFLTNFLFLFVISRIFWQNYSFEAKSFGILSLIRIGRLSSEPYTFAVAGTAKSDRFIRKNFSSIQIIVAYYILMTVISYLLFCLYFQRTWLACSFYWFIFLSNQYSQCYWTHHSRY